MINIFVSGNYKVKLINSKNDIVESSIQYLTAPIYRRIVATATLRVANGEDIVTVEIEPCKD